MRHRLLCTAAIAGLWLVMAGQAAGQIPAAATTTRAAGTAGTWTPARTADGQPDIQGYWGGRASFEEKGFDRPDVRPGRSGDVNCSVGTGVNSECAAYVQLFTGYVDGKPNFGRGPTEATAPRRPSGLIDVPDGKLPWTAAGAARRAENVRNLFEPPSLEFVDPIARCIPGVPRGGGPSSTATGDATQILQIPGHVVLVQEFNHVTRIIPIDGRPHLGAAIRRHHGDSIGRWEGTTLVVDTTNFVGGGWYDLVGTPQSDAMHVTERLTIVDANTLDYVVTIDDPTFFTRPWSFAGSFTRSEPAAAQGMQTIEILENACHEGSMAVENILERPGRPLPPEQFLPR